MPGRPRSIAEDVIVHIRNVPGYRHRDPPAGLGLPDHSETFPITSPAPWDDEFAEFPFEVHPELGRLLASSPELRAPNRLAGDTRPEVLRVNIGDENGTKEQIED